MHATFYIAYLHPYFDGNGRTARLLHLWYLVQQGFSSTLFYAFSKHINNSENKYYNSFLAIEENYKISKLLDMTPFIRYFKENVYDKIDFASYEMPALQIFTQAMSNGKITEKERDLWNFVFSAYGESQFSTKQLEKDFGNAAYATIRSFVLKFEKLGLLASQPLGNRVKYSIKGIEKEIHVFWQKANLICLSTIHYFNNSFPSPYHLLTPVVFY